MRNVSLAVLSLLFLSITNLRADDTMCASGPDRDAYVQALHARASRLAKVASNATAATATATMREGAFYLPADESLAPGHRPVDLAGRSLVFTPRGNATYALQRGESQYVPPGNVPLRDFEGARTGEPWYAVSHDLGFTFPAFGRSITRIYITAYNEIRFELPTYEQTAVQFDAAEAVVQPQAVLSPLITTSSKPRYLAYPRVYVEQETDLVRVTWISSAGSTFGYELQAELRKDGTIVYSYGSIRDLSWGAPLLTAGFDPASGARTSIRGVDDVAGDTSPSVGSDLRPMLDIRRTEVFRLDDSDVFAVRLTLGAAIDPSKLTFGQTFRYLVAVDDDVATIDIDAKGATITGFNAPRGVLNGAAGRWDGATIELYGVQRTAKTATSRQLRAISYIRPLTRAIDSAVFSVPFPAAPRLVASDLSSVENGTELRVPITEPFALAPLDVVGVWERLQSEYALSDYDYDGVAIYQSFYTDIIFYAGAYSTRGNPAVNGIAPLTPQYGRFDPRMPALLHMNQLTYNYSAAPRTASKVLLHEFGHRWLYFFSIAEDGQSSRVLNPASGHPAAYVHTPGAFRVYGEEESSVMGGGYFIQQGDGSYKARAANAGYSWMDLYLMGLAAPEEVAPFFYLAGTELAAEYWPPDNAVVTGTPREVQLQQMTTVHGTREPSAALSQRKFRVLFVLVTEPGKQPTDAEVAKLNEWRALMERDFSIATGGRGKVETEFVRPTKTRGVR